MPSGRLRATFASAVVSAVVVGVAAVPAHAQSQSRQDAVAQFTEQRPASSTGVHIGIVYRNPNDPNAKPFAVQKIVTTLAAGTVIDTSVPAQCTLSDAELMANGAGGCPGGSIVGSGKVSLASKSADPDVYTDVTLINNANELIFLVETDTTPRTRMLIRSPISGNTITNEVPPLPGGPPDGVTAIRTVDLSIGAVSRRDGRQVRNYITTPPACPASGRLEGSVAFTYFDGIAQTVPSFSACVDTAPPAIKLTGISRSCLRRGVKARVRVTDTSSLRGVAVRLNGRKVKGTRQKRFGFKIRQSRLRKGRNRVTVTAVDLRGNRSVLTRRFRRCG
ncbi:MAG: hypothetical protein ACR2HC_10370 [Thermoleophilaceae bacterium]